MNLDEDILVKCTDTNKEVVGKIIRIYRGGIDVQIIDSIIKMNLKNNNLYVGTLIGLEFTAKNKT